MFLEGSPQHSSKIGCSTWLLSQKDCLYLPCISQVFKLGMTSCTKSKYKERGRRVKRKEKKERRGTIEEIKSNAIRIGLAGKRSNLHGCLFCLFPPTSTHRPTHIHHHNIISVQLLLNVHEELGELCENECEIKKGKERKDANILGPCINPCAVTIGPFCN